MKERRGSGALTGPLALALGALLFVLLAAAVLAASTGTTGGATPRVRAPNLSLVVGLVIAGVLVVGIVVLVGLLRTLHRGELVARHNTVRDLLRLFVVFILLVVLFRVLPTDRGDGGSPATGDVAETGDGVLPEASGTDWATLVLVACVAAAIGWRVWRTRRSVADDGASEPLAAAVAEVLDDVIEQLRNEPDARRAVIAAYARMEDVFARHGLPRRPSETPLEFLARALEAVTEPEPARRLTDLFELAMFSTRPFDRVAQDEAVDALVAVRDDLRRRAAIGTGP
jgi:Domain of unknown function (DUF4129)